MKYFMRNVIFLTFIIVLISGCVRPQSAAPIEYNHDKSPVGGGYSNQTVLGGGSSDAIVSKTIVPKDDDSENSTGILQDKKNENDNIVMPARLSDNDQIIYYEVQPDETLEEIATKYDQTVEGIAHLNELPAPYTVKEFEVIKIKVTNAILNKKNKEIAREGASGVVPASLKKAHFILPVQGNIILRFGEQTNKGKNNGINIAAKRGAKVNSVADGVVIYSGFSDEFGNLIIVKLSQNDLHVAYAHLEELMIEKGAQVKGGELIGHVGSTGNVSTPQLYLAIKEGKTSVDPLKYIEVGE